ncbi:MAG: hypothetical protein M3P33_03995 [bacterium]|nr:hypothetical protein [bacterium]
MYQLTIPDGAIFKGDIEIFGNLNESLACISAGLYCDEPVILHNIPNNACVLELLAMLRNLGSDCSFLENKVVIRTKNIKSNEVAKTELSKYYSQYLIGPLISITGDASVPADDLTVDLDGKFGIKAVNDSHSTQMSATKLKPFIGKVIQDDLLCYTLLAMGAGGNSLFRISSISGDLDSLLVLASSMGCTVSRSSTESVSVVSRSIMKGCEHTIKHDIDEAELFLAFFASYESRVCVKNIDWTLLSPTLTLLEECGKNYQITNDGVLIFGKPTSLWKGVEWSKLLNNRFEGNRSGLNDFVIRLNKTCTSEIVVEEKQ